MRTLIALLTLVLLAADKPTTPPATLPTKPAPRTTLQIRKDAAQKKALTRARRALTEQAQAQAEAEAEQLYIQRVGPTIIAAQKAQADIQQRAQFQQQALQLQQQALQRQKTTNSVVITPPGPNDGPNTKGIIIPVTPIGAPNDFWSRSARSNEAWFRLGMPQGYRPDQPR